MINYKFCEVDPTTKVPRYAIIYTGVVIAVIVLFFKITFLAEIVSVACVMNYVTVMSIVVYRKTSKKNSVLL